MYHGLPALHLPHLVVSVPIPHTLNWHPLSYNICSPCCITCHTTNTTAPSAPPHLTSLTSLTGGRILKDRYLAKMFGTGSPNFPNSSYAAFASRDAVLISVSFIFAPLVGPIVHKNTGLSPLVSDIVAQISVPACAQLMATPIHLTGLDFYNRPGIPMQTRVVDAIKASRGPILIRMFRQGYVFGLGSLSVKYFTKFLLGE